MAKRHNTSPCGCGVVYHGPSAIPHSPPIADEDLTAAVRAHVERTVGPVAWTYSDVSPRYVRVEIFVVAPTPPRRRHFTLVTCGMSAAPMRPVCSADIRLHRAELAMCLAPDWPLAPFTLSKCSWPVDWLRLLARMPHEFDTSLGLGHSVPNGDPPMPIAGTGFTGIVMMPLVSESKEFRTMHYRGKHIEMLGVWPVYRQEMSYKLRWGAYRLWYRLLGHGAADVVDVSRHNVCAGSRG